MITPLQQFPGTLTERRSELDAARARLLDEVARARGRSSVAAGAGTGAPWSLAELVYHLHLGEKLTALGLQRKLASTERVQPASEERLREEWERIRKLIGTRHTRVPAPARVAPDNAPDLDRALALLTESRRAFLQVIESAPEKDLLSIALPHPFPVIGELIGISWTSATAFHELRHSEQVRDPR
jgi:hypothetical protein